MVRVVVVFVVVVVVDVVVVVVVVSRGMAEISGTPEKKLYLSTKPPKANESENHSQGCVPVR